RSPVPFDEVAGDDGVAVEAAREGRDAHPVIDPELQRLHALPNVRVFPLPALRVGVAGEATNASERVVDVAAAVRLAQGAVFGQGGGDPDLLRPPIEIDADLVGREHHERANACVRVKQALGVRVAAGTVQNGNRLGRLRPSWPMGSFARTMTPSVSRSA